MIHVVAMKGHPSCGKSTLARALGRALKWPVVDKDDIRDCTTQHIEEALLSSLPPPAAAASLNALAYQVMWRLVETQLRLGLSVIVDSPLSRPNLYETAAALSTQYGARLVIIECVASNTQEWKRRLEGRTTMASNQEDIHSSEKCPIQQQCYQDANEVPNPYSNMESDLCKNPNSRVDANSSAQAMYTGWHKPACWEDLQKLIEGYDRCWEYNISMAKKLIVDTTVLQHGSLETGVMKWLETIVDSTPAVSYLH